MPMSSTGATMDRSSRTKTKKMTASTTGMMIFRSCTDAMSTSSCEAV